MPRRPGLTFLLIALLAATASWGWWCFPKRNATPPEVETVTAAFALPYSEDRYADAFPLPAPWQPPSGQRQGRDWVYDLFTPAEIFYDAGLKEFRVTPPATEIAQTDLITASADGFGLELIGVRRGIFRLQLIGFVRTDRGTLGLFENAVTRESFLATSGRSVPSLNLSIEDFEVGLHLAQPEITISHQVHATALVRDQLTGEAVTLTTAARCHSAGARATLVATGSDSGEREIGEGDIIEVGGAHYSVASIQLSPPSVTLCSGAMDDGPIERRTLHIRPANTEKTAGPSF